MYIFLCYCFIIVILILVGIDPRNLLTKAEVDAVMSEIAYPHYVFIIPEDQSFSYPLTIQDFIQLIERNPESYSQISKIRKHLCRSIFSPSRSNEILDRPNVVLHREQYQLTHKGKLPKRNFCLTFYNAITCTKNIDKFDYEILTSQREVAVRMILDYIRIIFSDAANSTNRNTSTIGRSATHSYGSNPFSPPNYKNSSNIIGRYKHSNSSSGPDNTTNTNTINTETGKEIRTNSNSISAVSPVVTKTSLQLQHNTNQALLYAHSGSVPSTGIMNTATRRRRSTSTRTQVASLGIARRAKEYDNSMALDKTPPLELLTAENTTADNTTIENTAEEKKDEINLNLTSVEQTPPLLEVDESNNTIDK